jgi:hypothetical protein
MGSREGEPLTTKRRGGAEANAIRICNEVSRLNAGRNLRWHEAAAIEKRLGLKEKAAQMAYDFAVTRYWIAAVGDPVSSITLIEAGHAMVAQEEELRPTKKPTPRKSR